MEQLEKILFQSELVDRVITLKDLNSLAHQEKNVSIIMGQTFDEGQPVDIVKYGLFIMELEDYFKKHRVIPLSKWVLADHFITIINKEKEQSEILSQRNTRQSFLEKINSVYHGKIEIVYSSDLTCQDKYKQILKSLQKESERNPKFRVEMLSSIPKDRKLNPESLKYPLEELATIFSLNTQIKVGPKYEANYDIPAINFAEKLGFSRYVAIHLTNSFPLGRPIIQEENQIEIESFGLTPYKINSKKLKEYRLDPINGVPSEERDLILQTRDFRAIKDIISCSILARKRLTGELSFKILEDLHDFPDIRIRAYELYNEYVKKPLTEGERK